MNKSEESFLFRCALATTVFVLIVKEGSQAFFLGLVNNVLIGLVAAFQTILAFVLSKRESRTAYFLLTGAVATAAAVLLETFFFGIAGPLGNFLPLLFVNTLLLAEEMPWVRKFVLGLLMWAGGFLIVVVRSVWIPETWGLIPASAFILLSITSALIGPVIARSPGGATKQP